jgi:hypothetical protein
MTRRGVRLTVAFLAVLGIAGCGTAEGVPRQVPDRAESAGCPETMPGGSGVETDDGSGRPLVPTSPEPVGLTLCVYGLEPVGRPGEEPPSTGPAPSTVPLDDADLGAVVADLNAMPAFVDAGDHVCNAAMWPGYLLLVDHRDGTVTALTVDRSCGLVADGVGAVRMGIPDVIADRY